MIRKRFSIFATLIVLLTALGTFTVARDVPRAQAANGDLVGSVTFSVDCTSGLGVGIAFDGQNLWYSCVGSSPDLLRADPTTGVVTASYTVEGGLGALAYDVGRGKLWAGAGCAPGQTGSEVYLIDPATGVATLAFNVPSFAGGCLDDGLAFDGLNDTIYHSWDGAVNIRHLSSSGAPLGDDGFTWGGSTCLVDGFPTGYNSGLAIGGNLLYEGSDGCSHVWVVDKSSKAAAFDFSTVVAGDPNFRDEDLECDNLTFKALGKEVMWSKEAYSPARAHAFEIPAGSCKFGGGGTGANQWMTGGGSTFTADGVRVTHGFALNCDASKQPDNLQVNWARNRFHLDSVTSASCTDDPAIDPNTPASTFDTQTGTGTGRYNGTPGYTIEWTLTDAGEPGVNDTAQLTITGPSGVVLSVSGALAGGNHQAHTD